MTARKRILNLGWKTRWEELDGDVYMTRIVKFDDIEVDE